MLYYAIVFAVLALLAGVLGFVALSGTLAGIAKVLLLVFVVLFVLSLVFGRGRAQHSDPRGTASSASPGRRWVRTDVELNFPLNERIGGIDVRG